MGESGLVWVNMRVIVLSFLLLGMLSVHANSNTGNFYIVTTIKPIEAMLQAITVDTQQTQSDQLIPAYASPHDYSFKPSDIRKIKRADVIFRIDEHMEMMFNPIFESAKGRLVSLADAEGIHFLEAAAGHEDHHSAHHLEQGSDNSSGNSSEHSLDMHIWSSPANAIAMAKKITNVLSTENPANKTQYETNLDNLINRINHVVINTKEKLAPIKERPYIVFHDSWQYFANYYDLSKPSVINFHEGVSSGVKTLLQVRQQIKSENIRCVFAPQGLNPAKVRVVTEKLPNIKVVEIDVLAHGFSLDKDTYVNWLKNMGEKVKACLQ